MALGSGSGYDCRKIWAWALMALRCSGLWHYGCCYLSEDGSALAFEFVVPNHVGGPRVFRAFRSSGSCG